MKTQQAGFTLIELVMVIVILGILSAAAVPKFIDMKSEAQQASVDGAAGALTSASAINYASRQLATNNGTTAVSNCQHVANALDNGLDAKFQIPSAGISSGSIKTNCVVRLAAATSVRANFTGRHTP